MFKFGSGVMTVTPAGANPTPLNIGLLQEGSVEVAQETKALYGQYRDPLAIGAGTRKWTGKAKIARFSGAVINALMFGAVMAAGMTTTAYEAQAVPGSVSYAVTVANSATFTADQGVIYAATGLPMKRVAAAPAAGQYTVAAGVYTFAAADASAALVIAYNYTVAGSGQNIVIPQSLIGPTLYFGLNFTSVDPTNSAVFTGQFNACVATKWSYGTKLADFAIPEFDWTMAANAAGSVGQLNFPDKF